MANTFYSLPKQLADIAVPIIEERTAPFDVFSTQFTTESRRTQNVTKHSVVGSTNTNPTSYTNTGDTTVGVDVSIDEKSQQFGVTAQEYLQGNSLEKLVKRNARKFANSLWDVPAAMITAANFANTQITVAQGSFSADNAKTAWASLAGAEEKYLMLDSTAFAEIMVVDSQDKQIARGAAYSYDGVHQVTKWGQTGQQANTYGFACSPDAFLLASGIPEYTPRIMELLDEEVVTLENTGLTVAFRHQVNINDRSEHASIDILFGAAVGDGSAGTIIKSA